MPDFFATAPQHRFFDYATHSAPRDEVASRSIGLLDEGVSNETILDAVIKHPLLVNRPIVYLYAQGRQAMSSKRNGV